MKKKIRLANRFIGEPDSCFVVAEAGSNHNGNPDLGKKLIESAKECGCDAVKFQAFKTESLVTKSADKGDYQKGKSSGKSQFDMLKAIELSSQQHSELVRYADKVRIPIFYSVFDKESADLIDELGISIFKLGSGELTNIPFIKYIAKKNKPLIISTGMADDEEIMDAVSAFREEKNEQLILMNCSTGYPSRLEDANLRRMEYLEDKFGVFCGNSDHTPGILVSVIAAALGAPLIEKHLTLDKHFPGPDHPMSMNPTEMKQLCSIVRILEKNPVAEGGLRKALEKVGMVGITQEEIEKILGRPDRYLSAEEKSQRIWARKSIVATRDINKGEVFTDHNLAIKRPQEGILPKDYEKVVGKKAGVFIQKESPISWSMVK
jgi:sialic acid synthase SpsE